MKKSKKVNHTQKFIAEKTSSVKNFTAPKNNIPTVSHKRYFARNIFFYSVLIFIITCISVLIYFVRLNPYFAFDLEATRAIQKFNPQWFDFLMSAITKIGNPEVGILLVAVVTGFLFWKKRKKEAIMLLISTIGTTVIASTLKQLIQRPRPDPSLIHQVSSFLNRDSFPSGHVLFYIGFFGFLLFLAYSLPPERRWRTGLISLLFLLIILIGPSRMYLGAHWFSDVMGAYLIGLVWLVVIISLYNKWKVK